MKQELLAHLNNLYVATQRAQMSAQDHVTCQTAGQQLAKFIEANAKDGPTASPTKPSIKNDPTPKKPHHD